MAGKRPAGIRRGRFRFFEHAEGPGVNAGGYSPWGGSAGAGMADELSLMLSPVKDGSSGTASVFAKFPAQKAGRPVESDLKSTRPLSSGGLHLRYLAKNAKPSE